MPGVLIGDKYKRIIKIATGWVLSKLGTDIDSIHDDMNHCGNSGIHFLYDLSKIASGKVKEKYQSNMIKRYSGIILWILYKDTAYKDVFIWILWQLLEHADEVKKMIKPYVKEPEDWYVNGWHESKKNSKRLQDRKDLPKTMKSLDESIYTPEQQRKLLNKYK